MSRVLVDNENYFNKMASSKGSHSQRSSKTHRPNRGSRMDDQELDLSGMQETIGNFLLAFIFFHSFSFLTLSYQKKKRHN